MALVEAVAGELVDLVEDHRGLRRLHAARGGAVDEGLLLGIHLRLDLLAHGAAQQVGATQRIAGQHLGHLHDLLLVDHDAEGLFQDRLQAGVQVVRLLLAQLDLDVFRDVVHRAGTVQRHQGDDVLEPVRLHALQHVAHAGAFQLEHADRVAAAHHFEAGRIVERDRLQRHLLTERRLDQLQGAGQHGQGL